MAKQYTIWADTFSVVLENMLVAFRGHFGARHDYPKRARAKPTSENGVIVLRWLFPTVYDCNSFWLKLNLYKFNLGWPACTNSKFNWNMNIRVYVQWAGRIGRNCFHQFWWRISVDHRRNRKRKQTTEATNKNSAKIDHQIDHLHAIGRPAHLVHFNLSLFSIIGENYIIGINLSVVSIESLPERLVHAVRKRALPSWRQNYFRIGKKCTLAQTKVKWKLSCARLNS